MSAGTINTLAGIFVLTAILLAIWLTMQAMVKSRVTRAVLVVVIVWLVVYPPIRIAIVAIPPGEILCAVALTAAIVVLHNKFGRR